jgi:hypothetical protein
MSKLATPQGDDHPSAAGKHLQDAGALLAAGRADGAAYLSGYVVECSLKSIFQLETNKPLTGHYLPTLYHQVSAVSAIAGAKTAKYFGSVTASVLGSPIASWHPGMRYRAPSMILSDAQKWHQTAVHVFHETIAEMLLDGAV